MFPKGFADFAQKGLQAAAAAGSKVRSEVKSFAAEAQKHTAEAYKQGKAAAAHTLSSNPAMGLVGQELRIGGKHLFVDSLLAEGGFAVVYLVSVVGSEGVEKYVLKKMFAGNEETIKQLTGEVKLMEALSHPNIVRVLGSETRQVGREGIEIYVLMEFCSGGHLLQRLNKQMETGRPLPPLKVVEVFLSVVKPVAYLHGQPTPTAHRDLKFENVLIASDGTLRLCDFGSASTHTGVIVDKRDRAEQEDAIMRFTTPHFRSPEMVDLYSGLPLDERVDIWALGCMLYGLQYFKHPFQDSGPLGILSSKYRVPASPECPAPIATAMRACLRYNPAERPTAAQLVTYLEAVKTALSSGSSTFLPLYLSGGGALPTAVYPTGEVNGTAPLAALMAAANVTAPPGAAVPAASAALANANRPAPTDGSFEPQFFDPGSGGSDVSGHHHHSFSGGVGSTVGADFTTSGGGAGAVASHGAARSTASSSSSSGGYHRPTAAEIAAKIGGGATSAAPSGALAARMARKGVASTTSSSSLGVSAPSAVAATAPAAGTSRVRAPSGAETHAPAAAMASDFHHAGSSPVNPPSGRSSPAFDQSPPSFSAGSASSNSHNKVASVADFADFDAFGASDSTDISFGGSAAADISFGGDVNPAPAPAVVHKPATSSGSSRSIGSSSSSSSACSSSVSAPAALPTDLDDFFGGGSSSGSGSIASAAPSVALSSRGLGSGRGSKPASGGGGADAFDLLAVGSALQASSSTHADLEALGGAMAVSPSTGGGQKSSSPPGPMRAAAAGGGSQQLPAVADDFDFGFSSSSPAPSAGGAKPATADAFAEFGF